MVKSTVKSTTPKNNKTSPKTKTAPKKDIKPKAIKPTTSTPENIKNKTRHFYVYYGKDNKGQDLKLEHTRLSGKRPKQAAQKALSSIIKYEKSKGNKDIIGKDIKFYIIETGRKKYREKKVGEKTKRVEIIKRKFYYIGKKEHIPADLNHKDYNDKKIIKVELEKDEKGKITKILSEKVIKDGKGREMRVILTNDNKVDAILISKKETTKTTKDGKVVKIPATYVEYQYKTSIKRDKEIPKEKKQKETTSKKETKTTKKAQKKPAKKETKKTITKKDVKKTPKKTEKKTEKKTTKK